MSPIFLTSGRWKRLPRDEGHETKGGLLCVVFMTSSDHPNRIRRRTLMAETNISFSGSIPQMYDRYLGPVLFEPYAIDLVRRAAAHAAGPVLEMACGTGIVTRQLRAHLAPEVAM